MAAAAAATIRAEEGVVPAAAARLEPYLSYDYLYDWQYNLVFAVGLISSALSMLGSGSIVHLILKDNHVNARDDIYHRLLLGLSCTDLVVTAGLFCMPFLVPATTQLLYAHGNAATCDVMGFLLQFVLGSYLYNAELSVYFLYTVKYGMRQEDIAARFEPYVHIVPVLVPVVTGSIGVATDAFNPSPLTYMCSPEPYPPTCLSQNNDLDCARGVIPFPAVLTIAQGAIMLLCAGVGIGCTWAMYASIQERSRVMSRRYSFDGSTNEAQKRRLRQVAVQAIFYSIAFLIGVVVILFATVVDQTYMYNLESLEQLDDDHTLIFVLILFCWFFYPLQGFYNQLIYVRPRIRQWKQSYPNKSWFWCYAKVLSGMNPPPTRSAATRNYHSHGGGTDNNHNNNASETATAASHLRPTGRRFLRALSSAVASIASSFATASNNHDSSNLHHQQHVHCSRRTWNTEAPRAAVEEVDATPDNAPADNSHRNNRSNNNSNNNNNNNSNNNNDGDGDGGDIMEEGNDDSNTGADRSNRINREDNVVVVLSVDQRQPSDGLATTTNRNAVAVATTSLPMEGSSRPPRNHRRFSTSTVTDADTIDTATIMAVTKDDLPEQQLVDDDDNGVVAETTVAVAATDDGEEGLLSTAAAAAAAAQVDTATTTEIDRHGTSNKKVVSFCLANNASDEMNPDNRVRENVVVRNGALDPTNTDT